MDAGATKKLKSDSTSQPDEHESEWFTQRRWQNDVTLKFDDGKELFASKEFLMYASPVFESMFSHNMKEKATGVVRLHGKNGADFLELLMCLHPRIAKVVSHKNVSRLVRLAHEYQMTALYQRCIVVLRIWMLYGINAEETHFQLSVPTLEKSKEMIRADERGYYTSKFQDIRFPQSITTNTILNALGIAVAVQDESLITEAIDLLSCINVKYYDKIERLMQTSKLTEKEGQVLKSNQSTFYRFDEALKVRIQRARLYVADNTPGRY